MTKLWKRVIYCIVLFVFGLAIYNYVNIDKTSGYFSIDQKKVINQNYYLYIQTEKGVVRLECTKQVYQKAEVNEFLQYRMYYISNKLTPTKGRLFFIKFDDKIDNRKNIKKD